MLVLDSVGLAVSTYYYNINKPKAAHGEGGLPKKRLGRRIPGYSLTLKGEQISDESIKDIIKEIAAGDDFPMGYKKINEILQEEYGIIINHKKTYRLCKELDILGPYRKSGKDVRGRY